MKKKQFNNPSETLCKLAIEKEFPGAAISFDMSKDELILFDISKDGTQAVNKHFSADSNTLDSVLNRYGLQEIHDNIGKQEKLYRGGADDEVYKAEKELDILDSKLKYYFDELNKNGYRDLASTIEDKKTQLCNALKIKDSSYTIHSIPITNDNGISLIGDITFSNKEGQITPNISKLTITNIHSREISTDATGLIKSFKENGLVSPLHMPQKDLSKLVKGGVLSNTSSSGINSLLKFTKTPHGFILSKCATSLFSQLSSSPELG